MSHQQRYPQRRKPDLHPWPSYDVSPYSFRPTTDLSVTSIKWHNFDPPLKLKPGVTYQINTSGDVPTITEA